MADRQKEQCELATLPAQVGLLRFGKVERLSFGQVALYHPATLGCVAKVPTTSEPSSGKI